MIDAMKLAAEIEAVRDNHENEWAVRDDECTLIAAALRLAESTIAYIYQEEDNCDVCGDAACDALDAYRAAREGRSSTR